jgi:hypothetical protein
MSQINIAGISTSFLPYDGSPIYSYQLISETVGITQ